jgi:hypothetical protein
LRNAVSLDNCLDRVDTGRRDGEAITVAACVESSDVPGHSLTLADSTQSHPEIACSSSPGDPALG